jgi:serine/threonine protein kinase
MTKTDTKIEVGTGLDPDVTVLGVVDDRGAEPVYLVWHHKSWCPMLCKVLQSKEAAQREAEILLALAHPNIVRCFGVSAETHLLLEYLEGPSLHQMVKSRRYRRLGINDALRITIYIGAALSHVHDRGALHLDVKPANIVVVNGRPVLCDFGIARWQSEPRPKGVTGTEDYIAPEECRLEQVTSAADIFSLGVTLYELLSGYMPFPERSDVDPYPQTLKAAASLRQHRPAVPVALERLVLRCLSRDPKARPALTELLPALNRFITSGPPMWPKGFHPERP